jgi:hypothetical protein
MAFLLLQEEAVEKKEPEAPGRSNDPASPPQWVREKEIQDDKARRAKVAVEDGHTIEEPGYGHGV